VSKETFWFSILVVGVCVGVMTMFVHFDMPLHQKHRGTFAQSVLDKNDTPAGIQSAISEPSRKGFVQKRIDQADEKQRFEDYVQRFAIPTNFSDSVRRAIDKGSVKRELAKEPIQDGQAVLAARAGGKQALTASLYVDRRNALSLMAATIPTALTKETEQTLNLKSEALSAVGFSALVSGDNALAEKAFTQFLKNFEASDMSPIIRLELVNVLRLQGKKDEAWRALDEVERRMRGDQEYQKLSDGLKQAMYRT